MKKSNFWVVGLIGLLLAGALVLAGCDEGCPDGRDCKVNATWSNYYERWSASGTYCSNENCFATRQMNWPGGVSGQDNIEKCNCL